MTGFFSRLFGGGKKKESIKSAGVEIVHDVLDGLIQRGGLDLSFVVTSELETEIHVELTGKDVDLLRDREGQLMDAIQLFVKRVLQHQIPDQNIHVLVDSDGFREESSQALMDLADKLKNIAVSKGKSVYIRALPPKDRKLVHQYLAEDGRVKSRSVGDGHFKKIKIFPTKENDRDVGSLNESVL
jgi:spoIIIJ-associated protein